MEDKWAESLHVTGKLLLGGEISVFLRTLETSIVLNDLLGFGHLESPKHCSPGVPASSVACEVLDHAFQLLVRTCVCVTILVPPSDGSPPQSTLQLIPLVLLTELRPLGSNAKNADKLAQILTSSPTVGDVQSKLRWGCGARNRGLG